MHSLSTDAAADGARATVVRQTHASLQRRRARRQGLVLHKIRRQDPLASDYGKWLLLRDGEPVTGLLSIEQVEAYLLRGGRTLADA